MKTMTIILFCIVQCIMVHANNEQYTGDKVFEVQVDPKDMAKVKMINDYAEKEKMDVWKEFDSTTGKCMVQISKSKQDMFVKFCQKNKVTYRVFMEDVKKMIDANMKKVGKRGCFDYNAYNRYEDIRKELKSLTYCNRRVMKLSFAGWTSEGRPLIITKLSYNMHKWWIVNKKPIIWIEGGMHAREWISQATAMFMIKRFLTMRHQDADIDKFLEKFQIWIVPVFNPDGYEYSISTDRLWRKTRTKVEGSKCKGIDPNRNFNNQFGGIGSSSDPCDLTYRGRFAEEAPCVRAFSRQLRKIKHKLFAYFTLHSFFQLLLTPNSYSLVLPPDALTEIIPFAIRFQQAVRKRFGTAFFIGPATFFQLGHSGNGPDYVHDVLRVSNSYIVELRDRGPPSGFGFLLPPDQIAPTTLETLDGIFAGVSGIKKPNW